MVVQTRRGALACVLPAVDPAAKMEPRCVGRTWGEGHTERSWLNGLQQWVRAGLTSVTSQPNRYMRGRPFAAELTA